MDDVVDPMFDHAIAIMGSGKSLAHLVKQEQTPENVSAAHDDFCQTIEALAAMIPLSYQPGREWSLVKTKLEEALMWAERAKRGA